MPRRKAVDNARLDAPPHFRAAGMQKGVPHRPPHTPPGTTSIVLTRRHHINGVGYGPGPLTIRTDLAAVLADQDSRAREEFASWFLSTPNSALIRPGGRKVPVAAHHFDQAFLSAEPVVIVDQNGIRR